MRVIATLAQPDSVWTRQGAILPGFNSWPNSRRLYWLDENGGIPASVPKAKGKTKGKTFIDAVGWRPDRHALSDVDLTRVLENPDEL